MHEMSIAVNIVEIAVEQAQKAKAEKINSIVLELGSLSGVVEDALQFCFSSATKNTMAENAGLVILKHQAQAHCESCGHVFSSDQLVPSCPQCGEIVIHVQGGRELRIKTINVD